METLTAATPADAIYTDFSRDVDAQGVVQEIASGTLGEVLAAALAWPEEAHDRIQVYVGEIETVEWFGEARQRLRPSYRLTELVTVDLLKIN